MVHPYYQILDCLYNIVTEMSVLNPQEQRIKEIEEFADNFLIAVLNDTVPSSKRLPAWNFLPEKYRANLSKVNSLLVKAPYPVTGEQHAFILATFAESLENKGVLV